MKTIRFNSFFKCEDKVVGYNALSDYFVVPEPFLFELFEAASDEGLLANLKDVHKDLFDVLVDKGLIIADNIDELSLVKDISYKTDSDDTQYLLTVNPTMNCNFKCWYCYEDYVKGSKMSNETM